MTRRHHTSLWLCGVHNNHKTSTKHPQNYKGYHQRGLRVKDRLLIIITSNPEILKSREYIRYKKQNSDLRRERKTVDLVDSGLGLGVGLFIS